MAILTSKDVEKMNAKDRAEKLKDLKIELTKAGVSQQSSTKKREIKKAIARIHTFNRSDRKELKEKK